jgi:hypothetical protein
MVVVVIPRHVWYSPVLVHARAEVFVSVVHSSHPLLDGSSMCMALLYKAVC